MRHLCGVVVTLAWLYGADAIAAERWPLQYQNQSANDFIWDKRTPGLVQATLPANTAEVVLDGLGGPPDPVRIDSDRYFSASACVPHACFHKSFFWYDTQTGHGLGAVLESGDEEAILTLSSKHIRSDEIPSSALLAVTQWLSDLQISPSSAAFIEKRSKKVPLDASRFKPRLAFSPGPNGPSFDCQLSATEVEQLICESAELSQLDLEVSQLFHSVRKGHSDEPSRNEVRDVQRRWLRERDTCASARTVEECLAKSYNAQRKVLLHWLPSRR